MIRFVTTNSGKLREARSYLSELEDVEGIDYDYVEIQADDLEPIAAYGAEEAHAAVGEGEPVIVEDSGLFVSAVGGFPGPYSSYVYETLGIERVSQLARTADDPTAYFRSVVGYCDGETVETFGGSVRGRIVTPRGEGGFGYDPIFEHDGRTFAELTTAEKNAISHRGRALAKLGDWLADESAAQRGTR